MSSDTEDEGEDELDEHQLMIQGLLAQADRGHEIVVSWTKELDRPVSIFLIRVNGVKVVHDDLDQDSPFVTTRVPPPDANGQFTIDWSIKPEVPIDHIAISIRNRATAAQVLVDEKANPDLVSAWTKLGVIKDAP